jgi:glutamate-1-semialdehyde 2,1-aminomutase
MTAYLRSQELFEAAQQVLVGGVDSPVRAFKHVGGFPLFVRSGQGPYLHTEDDRTYVDYVLSWGPLLLGHAHPRVVAAITAAAHKGTSFGAPTSAETSLALRVQEFFPSMEKLRFVNSGTEACMSAIRLARGFTGRSLLVKFEGCYHGHADGLLVSAGSGGLTHGCPDSAGVTPEVAAQTLVLPYNDTEALQELFLREGHRIAAVIVEPVCGNMGVVLPLPEFLPMLRRLCTTYGSVLIFDEVMTGFRVHPGGAQALYGVKPDLTCLGKVVGGGLPCAAYGGSAEIMAKVAPDGPVYQAGTLSGNPVAMAAGLAMLETLEIDFSKALDYTTRLCSGIADAIRDANVPAQVTQCGTMFCVIFSEQPLLSLADVQLSNLACFKRYFWGMLEAGVYVAPSQFEANFVSSAHDQVDLDHTLQAVKRVFGEVKSCLV